MITDYDTLVTEVTNWLNRPRLAAQIPTFIQLAEKDIFRMYESRPNEVVLQVDRTAESPLTDTIDVPSDYREMITFKRDGVPLQRKSLTEIQGLKSESARQGPAEFFAREFDKFQLWPFPDKGLVYELYYFAKLTPLTTGQTNAILQSEPGLYLFGSLLKAEPYVKGEAPDLIAVWAAEYQKIIDGVEEEHSREQRSGSNTEVQSAFGGRQRRVRTGWA